MTREVGIIGFGRCGRLAARLLGERYRLAAADRRDLSGEARALGVDWGPVAEVAARSVVLLAVPIRVLPDVLDEIAPHLARGALVVDLCSVKVRPMEWMAARLPAGVRWAGTHPLFGPDSVREQGASEQRIVVCAAPGQADAALEVCRSARELGLEPLTIQPDDHDRAMARSQALVFLAARSLRRAGIALTEFGTPSERRLYSALRLVEADSDELYEDILRLNPFAAAAADALAVAIRGEVDRLTSPP